MIPFALMLFLVWAADVPAECRNPPSRTSAAYWSFLDACGCEGIDPVPQASSDYDRYLQSCRSWRERNPVVTIVVASASPSPLPTTRDRAAECRTAPPRSSSTFWAFLDACGCSSVEPVPRASADYDRYMKACSSAREREPRIKVVVSPSPSPSTK